MTGPLADPELRARWDTVLADVRRVEHNPVPLGEPGTPAFGVAPSAQACLSLDYLDAIEAACPGAFELTIDETPGETSLAAIYVERKGPYRIIRVPPFTSYTSIASTGGFSTLNAAASALVKDAHAFRLHFPPMFSSSREHAQPHDGWTVGKLYTCFAPISTADVLQRYWSANPRRTFAREHGRFQVQEEASSAAALAQLMMTSYARHGRRPELSVDAISRLVSVAVDRGIARLFVCRDGDGEARAAVAFLVQDRAAWYWSAGSYPGPAMTVLIGTVLPRLYDLGVTSFDFVGANTPSITEFKRRFGSIRQEYDYVAAVRRPELRALTALRTAVAGMRRG